MKVINRGYIVLDQQMVLNFLQFPHGRITKIGLDGYDRIELFLEDEEMPEVREGEPTPIVCPVYTVWQDCTGDRVVIREKLNVKSR